MTILMVVEVQHFFAVICILCASFARIKNKMQIHNYYIYAKKHKKISDLT